MSSDLLKCDKHNLTSQTFVAAISGESGRAYTTSPMIVDTALGVRGTIARILTFLIATSQVVRAVLIRCTFWTLAANQRITLITVQTVARYVVAVIESAYRISTALDLRAGVHTVAVDARFRG